MPVARTVLRNPVASAVTAVQNLINFSVVTVIAVDEHARWRTGDFRDGRRGMNECAFHEPDLLHKALDH